MYIYKELCEKLKKVGPQNKVCCYFIKKVIYHLLIFKYIKINLKIISLEILDKMHIKFIIE